ncbi:MAG: alpha/beta fold hydrolase [Dehalococcoidia bacterium]|nr:alpha/beta fold hydrolase [Dehalococcoidia bacterium]MCB9484473.1 alpha/beta fold hydrolase [Thermoflexaceae bacterium]
MARQLPARKGAPGWNSRQPVPGPIRYTTSRDGTHIAWTSWGAGPSLIFVPPWTETIESGFFHSFIRRLFSGRIVLYDRRGFGRSDWGVEHGLEQYADDLEAVADAAGIDRIVLLAQAAGTFESVVLAARTPQVQTMVLFEPVLRVEASHLAAQKSLYALLDKDFATFWRAFLQFAIGWGESWDIEAMVRYYVTATNPADIRALLDVLLFEADLSRFAPLVQADTLLVHNGDDSLMPPEGAANLARLLPRQRLLITSGRRLDLQPETAREIECFLQGSCLPGGRGWLEGVLSASRATTGATALTRREGEVLELVVTGATNAEVAATLSLSKGTVARHLANVYAKLGVRNRVEAVAWAMERIQD